MGSIGGTRAESERLLCASERRRGGFLWAPWAARGPGLAPPSVPPKAARRLNAGQLVEIEFDDGLQLVGER